MHSQLISRISWDSTRSNSSISGDFQRLWSVFIFCSQDGGDWPPYLGQGAPEWGGWKSPKWPKSTYNYSFFHSPPQAPPKNRFFDVFERFPHLKTQKTFKKDRFLSLGRPPKWGGIEFFPWKMGGIIPPIPPIWVGNINTVVHDRGQS